MKITVKSPVWDDLRKIGIYIARDDPAAAHRFFLATKRAFGLFRRHPGIGRLRSFSQPGIRSFPVPGFGNYLVFYLPLQMEIQILAVLHGAQDLEPLMRERL